MRLGLFLQTCEARSRRVFPVDEVVRRIERAEALGFASAWVMDHLFVEREGGRTSGHEPMVLLAHAAARTSRIGLGTLVLCTPFRHPAQLAREAAALADASGGRFVLGLGSGWQRSEFEAMGLPLDHLVGRFEAQAGAVRRLLHGETVGTDGPYLRLEGARVAASAAPPPLWIAGGGPRMLRLTARLADGWNLAWGEPDPGWLAAPLDGLRRELEAAGRDRTAFTISAGVSIVPEPDARELARTVRAYERTGIDLLILSLAPGPVAPTRPEYLEWAAAALD